MNITYTIHGGHSLHGHIDIKGSPIATMALMSVALLTVDKVTLQGIPHLHDLDRFLDELRGLNIVADWTHQHEVTIYAATIEPKIAVLSESMVGWSILMLTALLIRTNELVLHLSQDVVLDEHFRLWVEVVSAFGGIFEQQDQELHCRLPHLYGAQISLDPGRPELTMVASMLAAKADGVSELSGIATDPEVEDVLECLTKMGAIIQKLDNDRLVIQGLSKLRGATHKVMADRFEAAVLALAGILTGGDVLVKGVTSSEMMGFLAKLKQLNAPYQAGAEGLHFWADPQQAFAPMSLASSPHPGMNAVWLSIFLPLLSRADGESTLFISDSTMWNPVLQLLKTMGAEVYLQGDSVHIFGPVKLVATQATVEDFMTALVGLLGGLTSSGVMELQQVDLLDSRFEDLVQRLNKLVAKITRQEIRSTDI